MKPLLFLLGSLLLALGSYAQNTSRANPAEVSELTVEDYLGLELPPLGELLDNARKNPSVTYYQARIADAESDLKSERRNWLNYFKLNASYYYGQMNDNTLFNDGQIPSYYRYQGKEQSYYNLGASVSVPLDGLFDRRNRVRQQRSRVEAAEREEELWFNDLALKIVDQYTAALEHLSLLQVRAEAVTVATAQYRLSEIDFANGNMDAQTLSKQKNIQSAAVREYEQTRAALNSALLKLEILTCTPILHKTAE